MIRSDGDLTKTLTYWARDEVTEISDTFDFVVPGTYKVIADEKPGFTRYGNCYHRKVNVRDSSKLVKGDQWSSTANYALATADYLVDPEPDSGFNSRAFTAMKPRIEPVIQAPVELREFVTGWKELLKPFGRQRSLASKAGSANLWWQFGVAPTIGAVQDVINGLEGFERRLRDFLRHQGKELTTHYVEVDEVNAYTNTTGERTNPSEGYWKLTQRFKEHKFVYTATMKYKYLILGLDGMSDTEIWLRAIGDLLGVSRILAMTWESTPWSFVVDWFFTVGDFLEQFDKPFLDTAVEVLDYCISTKVTQSSEVFFDRSEGPVLGGTIYVSFYHRIRCLPDYSSFGIRTSDRFGPKQLLLSLSLLVA